MAREKAEMIDSGREKHARRRRKKEEEEDVSC